MVKIEYLRVQSNHSDEFIYLIAVLEETKNDYHSRLSVELFPLTHTKSISNAPFTSRHPLFRSQFNFDLELSHASETAKFATRCDVMLPPALRGCGLGSYAFSRLIEWGQSQRPTYRVEKLTLSDVDAQTNEARNQRNGFYEKHGFKFCFSDSENKTGFCHSETLALLRSGINSDKVVLLDLFAEMPSLIISNERLTKENTVRTLAIENCLAHKQQLIFEKGRLWLLVFVVVVVSIFIALTGINGTTN